ncbi:MAG TPA: SIMPL domain-containing protein [Acidimicrobiales bacterium]|nr:SIMPL domain-containing protein [Acidimicrobiales bacterium]
MAVGALVVGGTGLGLALSAGATTPVSTAVGCNSSQPRLTVQGTGQADGTPDVLTAVFGFSSSAASATASLSQNNAEVNQALAALSSKGVAQTDVQTTGLTLAPQYVYPHGVQTPNGFAATNTITATLRDIKSAGDAIDAVVNATGDAATINSLNFSFANPAQVEDQARSHAVHQAVAHAVAMAAAAGRRLGPVCSLTDNTQPTLFEPYASGGLSAANDHAASVPVEPGSQTETDQVTMVYALEHR